MDEIRVVDPNATDEEIDAVLDKMAVMRQQGSRTILLCEDGRQVEITDGKT